MKKIKLFLVIFAMLFSILKVQAVEFQLLVLPADLFSVCDNYFCFPEVSNIIAEDTINNFRSYPNIKTVELAQARSVLEKNSALKAKTESVLSQYRLNEKIDFNALKDIADAFGVKSVLLITGYATNDKVNSRRNLWNILEISSAFQITYPFELKTSAVLTDCVNNIVMWSGKYSKTVSDTEGFYSAANQTQAMSQLEKVKIYSHDNISQNISQNVFMRFFPRDVRTFDVAQKKENQTPQSKFVPNALEHLSDPHIRKQFEKGDSHIDYGDSAEEFIFEF